MTSAPDPGLVPASALILKTTPPRAPRHQLLRPRLSLDDQLLADRAVMVVQAPPGFGKTSLLGQWRREHLTRGATVAWLTADEHEDPQYFLQALVFAVRTGCSRPGFGRLLFDAGRAAVGVMEGMTNWLAEVAQTSLDMVLVVDEAERLSPSNFEALSYLVHNLPSNLRVIIAGRSDLEGGVGDLVDNDLALTLGADRLAFRIEESIEFIRSRLGAGIDVDTCARLHELTEGWPLGLQLLLSAVGGRGDAIDAMRGLVIGMSDGEVGQRMVGSLLDKLAADDESFLVRISTLEMLHPELCGILTQLADVPERLARLIRDTPMFVVNDGSEWCRLHALARDALRERFALLPEAERFALHARAADWLAGHGMIEEAVRHANAAGDQELALDLAEQGMYDAVTRGYWGSVLDWLGQLPESELDRRPRLRLAAAWAMSLSERQQDAGRLVARILENPGLDEDMRYECALVLGGAAYFADQPDRYEAIFSPWIDRPTLGNPRLAQTHANRQAVLAIMRGDPVQARRYQQQVPRSGVGKGHVYAGRWAIFIIGSSYLQEGQMRLAEEVLRPGLLRIEADLGRRHPLACMMAALLASVVYEFDRLDEATSLLANRLDVLEQAGPPETALLGYRTAARIAAAQGVEHRALDLLEALNAVGVSRHLPRLCVAALADQVRIHAGKYRSETCRVLVGRIDEIITAAEPEHGPLWRRTVDTFQQLAHALEAISAQDWARALDLLPASINQPEVIRIGRLRIEAMALRAFVLDRLGRDGKSLLMEAINLATTVGVARTFADAHPVVADWVRQLTEERADFSGSPETLRVPRSVRPRAVVEATPQKANPTTVLTPKEREVLELLARNLSNKEIAQALSASETTIKWHVKNLFSKLYAGTRKHAVRRAQLLGLLEYAE